MRRWRTRVLLGGRVSERLEETGPKDSSCSVHLPPHRCAGRGSDSGEGSPERSQLGAGPFARTRGSCGHSWGNLKPRVAPVRSPSPTPGPWGVSGGPAPSASLRPLTSTRSGSRVQGGLPGGGGVRWPARPRPLGPPSLLLRTRLRVPGLAAAASPTGDGGGGSSGHGGGRRGRRHGLELPGPRSEPPLPHLSSATPSSSLSLLPPDPLTLPPQPSLRCSHLSVPSSSLHPAPHPGPGLHLSGLGLPHTGRILPRRSFAPNRLYPVCPALGAPDPAPTPARRLQVQGEVGVDEVQGENGQERSGSGPEPLAIRPSTRRITSFPFHAPPHPFSLIFPGPCPRFHPCGSPPCPLPAKETHTLSLHAGKGAWSRGCCEGWAAQGGSPQAPLEGRLREESRSLGRVSQALPPGLKKKKSGAPEGWKARPLLSPGHPSAQPP